jgi:hypothetical protein
MKNVSPFGFAGSGLSSGDNMRFVALVGLRRLLSEVGEKREKRDVGVIGVTGVKRLVGLSQS